MLKEQALYKFWSSFGIPAYDEASTEYQKNKSSMPYITYQVVTDSLGDNVSMVASVWYYSSSWKEISEKTEEVSKAITRGGAVLPCDGGAIWIRKGTPFAQSMGDDSDILIKRKLINITAEFLTSE